MKTSMQEPEKSEILTVLEISIWSLIYQSLGCKKNSRINIGFCYKLAYWKYILQHFVKSISIEIDMFGYCISRES